jgi:hypothetical protein
MEGFNLGGRIEGIFSEEDAFTAFSGFLDALRGSVLGKHPALPHYSTNASIDDERGKFAGRR